MGEQVSNDFVFLTNTIQTEIQKAICNLTMLKTLTKNFNDAKTLTFNDAKTQASLVDYLVSTCPLDPNQVEKEHLMLTNIKDKKK